MPALPGATRPDTGSPFASAHEVTDASANAASAPPVRRSRLCDPRRIPQTPSTFIPMMTSFRSLVVLGLASFVFVAAPSAHSAEPVQLQRLKTPSPPWPPGDERGMANQIGPATWARCAFHLAAPGAKVYELSYPRSNTM